MYRSKPRSVFILLLGFAVCGIMPTVSLNAQCTGTPDLLIRDCSPTLATYSPLLGQNSTRSVFGKILSLAVASDGQRLYAGAYSGVWRSDDSGATWRQMTRPQPFSGNAVPGSLSVPNVWDLAISADDIDVVLAATATTLSSTSDTFVPDRSRNGIYRSSDGGNTWRLVHQFVCPALAGAQPGSQVIFAPDNSSLVFAAGGCAIALSRDAGRTWVDKPLPVGGIAWHVAPASIEERNGVTGAFFRRLYAAGPDQFWYSEDLGTTWFRDASPALPTSDKAGMPGFPVDFGGFGAITNEGATGTSAQILAVEPGHPDRVYLAVPINANGPSYYFGDRSVDATPCNTGARSGPGGCGEAGLWIGDYSRFLSAGDVAQWTQLPGPPEYFGGCPAPSTPSGRAYVVIQRLPATLRTRPYLLFFGDESHVHVTMGRPQISDGHATSNSWHRLDGRDASQTEIEGQHCNQLFVHVDPHALVTSSDFLLRLRPAEGVTYPYDQNSVLDTSFPILGTIWMANDGGVYRSTDGGQTWSLVDNLSTLAAQFPFAGVVMGDLPPAMYFGGPDNDNFFTLDGGATWGDPVTGCGDCGAWFADPAQPDRVVELDRGSSVSLYVNSAGGYPNAGDGTQHRSLCLPGDSGSGISIAGYRPLILTNQRDSMPTDADFVLIRLAPAAGVIGRVLRTRTLSQITLPDPQMGCAIPTDWDSTSGPNVFQQGPDFHSGMELASIVQVSGGHDAPVFYVYDPGGLHLWKWAIGLKDWQQIVPAADGSATIARRFFANPYDPQEIYIIDQDAVRRTTDGGTHWNVDSMLDRTVTENGRYRYDVENISNNSNTVTNAVIRDMVFVSNEKTRFAVGNAGVFFSPNGRNWERLLSTRAMPGHPAAAFFDSRPDPSNRALYVGMDGRGILRLGPIPDTR